LVTYNNNRFIFSEFGPAGLFLLVQNLSSGPSSGKFIFFIAGSIFFEKCKFIASHCDPYLRNIIPEKEIVLSVIF